MARPQGGRPPVAQAQRERGVTADRPASGPGDAPFDLAPFVARLGPTVVAAALRAVDQAPPLSTEQRSQIRAVFQSVPRRPRRASAA